MVPGQTPASRCHLSPTGGKTVHSEKRWGLVGKQIWTNARCSSSILIHKLIFCETRALKMLVMHRVPTQRVPHTPKETHPTVSVSGLERYNFALRDDPDRRRREIILCQRQDLKENSATRTLDSHPAANACRLGFFKSWSLLLGLERTGCLYFYFTKFKDTETCFECKQDTALL